MKRTLFVLLVAACGPKSGAPVHNHATPPKVDANAHATIVDRHEDAGCMTFAGGRGWFEQVSYRLPDGEKFGGTVKVEYDEHIVAKDYSDRQPDGSPCPPPAIDGGRFARHRAERRTTPV